MDIQTVRLEKFQSFLTNAIDWEDTRDKKLAVIIGDTPSKYAKSPVVWNAGFEALGLDAVFLPFDVPEERLSGLVEAVRQEPRFLGFSVTIPYKIKVISLLDELDSKAKAIGAVNTVVRNKEGRLIGYNTDGQGGMDALTKIPVSGVTPFVQSLKKINILLIGAGGAARALAVYLGEALDGGKLYVANRDVQKAEGLCEAVTQRNGHAVPLPEKEISRVAKEVSLIINATTKGQQGLRRLPDGTVTSLEPYSALASASPPSLSRGDENTFFLRWMPKALKDIEKNNRQSLETFLDVPATTSLLDIIYAPLETVFLRQGRWTGHRILNGKTMNIAQAADAFYEKVVKPLLQEKGLYTPHTYRHLFEAMTAKW